MIETAALLHLLGHAIADVLVLGVVLLIFHVWKVGKARKMLTKEESKDV